MKGNHSASKSYALAILEDRQMSTAVDISKLQAVAIEQLAAIPRIEREAALRALLVGLTLHRIKAALPYGEFSRWIAQKLPQGNNWTPATAKKNASFYMRLARAFVDCMNVSTPEILALPGDQKDLAIEPKDAIARRFMEKAANFVGNRSLNELLDHLHIKDCKPLGGARPGAKKDTRTEEEKLAELRETVRAELASWITRGRHLLIEENVCQHLSCPAEIAAYHEQLIDLKADFTKAIQPLLKKSKA